MKFPCCLKFSTFSSYISLFMYSMTTLVTGEHTNYYNNSDIPAVFVFGDSIVDTGNNNYIKTLIRVNYLPYGRDFMGGRPTGRFSDGKVPADLIVEELGIKGLLPAYLDPTLKSEDLITGVNFASGGAGYDPLTSELVSVISLSGQLELFKEYIMKLKAIVGEERTASILAKSVFINVCGSNDITNTYFGTTIRSSHYDVSSYTDLMLDLASTFVQDLYRLGARRIGILSLPPLGCLPAIRTVKGGPRRNCFTKYNQIAQLFNAKLSHKLQSLTQVSPGSRMIYIDIYQLLLDVINHPQSYGFGIANIGCCGTGMVEVAYFCNFACPDVGDYVFWDSFHPTERAYRFLVREILKIHITSFIS